MTGLTDRACFAPNSSSTNPNYVAYAYPKNVVQKLDKSTVGVDQNTTIGSTITYLVAADVPHTLIPNIAPPPATMVKPITAFSIKDELPSTLEFNTAQVVAGALVAPASFNLVDGATTTPIPAACYTATFDPPVAGPPASGNVLTVTFTTTGVACNGMSGVQWLTSKATITAQVQLKFDTKVIRLNSTTVPGGIAEIENKAYVTVDSTTTGPEIETTHFGGVRIHKVTTGIDRTRDADYNWTQHIPPKQGAGGTLGTPNPATFRLYPTQADAYAGTNAIRAADSTGTLNPITPTNPQGLDYTTDAEGHAAILNLWYDPTTDDGSRDCIRDDRPVSSPVAFNGTAYWVVETVAPLGYELNPEPMMLCVVGPLDGDETGDSPDDYDFVNVKTNAGFPIPFTGELADNWTVLVGALVIASGMAFYIIRLRRRHATVELSA
jgi:fimbrial isopeptide formation D2 family protein